MFTLCLCFCRRRFVELFRALHFNDNSTFVPPGQPGFDKIFKVRPLVDRLNQVWKKQWNPGWALSVDEMMVGFKGRSHMRQYIPAKIIKWGFKLWAMCCGKSGFCLQFDPYQGKRPGEVSQKDTGGNVVRGLAALAAKPGSCIFADNFFTSPLLLKDLKEKGIDYVGTVRANRKHFPREVLIKQTKHSVRGEIKSAVCSKTDIRAVCWLDNKPVAVMSTVFTPTATYTAQRRGRDAQGFNCPVAIPQPEMIRYYNLYMGGVDQMDQLRANYPFERVIRSNLWYKKLYLGIFGIALNNA